MNKFNQDQIVIKVANLKKTSIFMLRILKKVF